MKNEIISQTFTWLFIGLLICFGVSYVTSINDTILTTVYGAFGGYGYLIYVILELVVAFVLILRVRKLNPTTAKILYLLYTALTGLSLTGIFIVYTESSIAFVFLATAIIFGIFALIGKTTKMDLTKWSTYLFVALLAIIILELINIFIANNTLNMVLCIASILIFCAYTAYDMQLMTNKGFLSDTENKSIYCAFQLFLDFINIFIRLLELFGKRRD